MKTFIKFFATAILLLLLSVSSFAQGSASTTADASATIVTPISILKQADLEFGDIAVSETQGGTVELLPMAGVATRNPLNGVTLPAYTTNIPTAARFLVQGVPYYTYNILLPDDGFVLTHDMISTETMIVNDFTSSPSGTNGELDMDGKETLYVGATLVVAASQEPGHYVSLVPFNVTVNYN
jgi:hypothetical protein